MSTLILVGGIGGDRSRNSSEFISLDQESNPLKGPDLPFNISSHCMIQFNSEAIYIIGGRYVRITITFMDFTSCFGTKF